jgi:beta-lactamase class A
MDQTIGEQVWSRRRALAAGGAGLVVAAGAAGHASAAAQPAPTAPASQKADLAGEVLTVFGQLPGRKALKLWAPADAGLPEWSVTLNSDTLLFIASAFKVFVLTEYLRQAEAALDPAAAIPLRQQLNQQMTEEWPLDASVYTLGSPIFNPPNLTGKVTARAALQAMISDSDNTGADMALAHVGADRVRAFIASIGLRNTRIPTSTRDFIGYAAGFPDWQQTTWAQLEANTLRPVRPIINDQITMASTPDDLVSFYARALQGEFFRYPETLAQFRATLMLAGAIPQSMPLGVNAFLKGGSLAFRPEYALSLAGGLYLPNRWLYFALIYNWTDADGDSTPRPYEDAIKRIFALVHDHLPR